MRKYNYRLVKTHRIYTIKELSLILGVHVDTIRTWVRQGLKTVPNTISPILIRGKDLKSFLRERQKKRKCKLEDNQFYCLRCRQTCHSEPENIKAEIHETLLSDGNHKAVIYGICEMCGSVLQLFSSERIIQNWLEQGWAFKENVTQRYNSNKPSGNLYSQCDTITTLGEASNV